jgi:hypothetical protein
MSGQASENARRKPYFLYFVLLNFAVKKRIIHRIIRITMIQEREPQKEPEKKDCKYCGPGFPATWQVIGDDLNEFVCDKHRSTLIEKIRKERLLSDAEWTMTINYEEDLNEHEFEDLDQWEDGSMYGF